jgi:hypothetical protein
VELTQIPPLRATWAEHGRPNRAIYHGDGEHPYKLGGEDCWFRPDGTLIHVSGMNTLLSEYFGPDDPIWLSPADTERQNPRPLRAAPWRGHNGHPEEWVPLGGRGEPTRTPEDMRWAMAGRISSYLGRFPDPGVTVDDVLALRTATLIVRDHYTVPCTVMLMRDHLLAYVRTAVERSGTAEGGEQASADPDPRA